jgi:hypothetical protein
MTTGHITVSRFTVKGWLHWARFRLPVQHGQPDYAWAREAVLSEVERASSPA